jgi:hypothetical protein
MDQVATRSSLLPIGSSAVESAIRRVINLTLKSSNAPFWLREHAEAMIHPLAWIKAGRAESLFPAKDLRTTHAGVARTTKQESARGLAAARIRGARAMGAFFTDR